VDGVASKLLQRDNLMQQALQFFDNGNTKKARDFLDNVDELDKILKPSTRSPIADDVAKLYEKLETTVGSVTEDILRKGQEPIKEGVDHLDKVARDRFDIPKLERISGGGSDRDVFALGEDKVLKIAKTNRGLAQNDVANDWYLQEVRLIPRTVETGKNYQVVERVGKPDQNTKDLIKKLNKFSVTDWENKTSELQEVLVEYEIDDIMNYDIMWNDFTAVRNWGTAADGSPVHLDEGTFNNRILQDYKGKTKNLDDPEFRDAYYQSKAAKKKFSDTDKYTMYGAAPIIGGYNVEKNEDGKYVVR
jgi:hypothetical protein